ncbi:hypothetical protein QJQ45_003207 [Haematococcus lacustris]|nr:hypothetical protein QJQ45_003207 [Haematococcus lacustris]
MLAACQAQQLAAMLLSLHALSHTPHTAWQASAFTALAPQLHLLNAQQLCATVAAVEALGMQPGPAWQEAARNASSRCLHQLSAPQLVAMVSSLAEGGMEADAEWGCALEAASLPRLGLLSPHQLATLLQVKPQRQQPHHAPLHPARPSQLGGLRLSSPGPSQPLRHLVLTLRNPKAVPVACNALESMRHRPSRRWMRGLLLSFCAGLFSPAQLQVAALPPAPPPSPGRAPCPSSFHPPAPADCSVVQRASSASPVLLATDLSHVVRALQRSQTLAGSTALASLSDASRCVLSLMTPEQLSHLLRYFAACQYRPCPNWCQDYLAALQAQLPSQTMTQLAEDLALLHALSIQPCHGWLAAWAGASQERLCLLPPLHLHQVLVTMGAAGFTPPRPWLQQAAAVVGDAAMGHSLETPELLACLVILQRMAAPPLPATVMQAVFASSGSSLDKLPAPVLAQLSWALQGAQPGPGAAWLRAYMEAARAQLHVFSQAELQCVVAGLRAMASEAAAGAAAAEGGLAKVVTATTPGLHPAPSAVGVVGGVAPSLVVVAAVPGSSSGQQHGQGLEGSGGASGSGQQDQGQGQGQAVKVVIAERRQVIKACLRGLVEAALPDLSPAQVDAIVAEINKRMTMGSKQCVLAAVLCLSVLLLSFLGQPTPGFPAAAGPAPGPPLPPDPTNPPYAHPRIATRSSPRTAAAPAQLPPPVQLGIWDPQLLAQIRDAMELLTKASVIEHMMRGPHHHGIRLLPGEVAAFEQPSNAWPVAILQQLDEEHLTGDGNSLNANANTIITSIQEFYRHPGRFIRWWCKAVGVVEEGFSRAMKKHFPQLVLGRLDYSLPDRQHKWRLPPNSVLRQPRWREEVVKHRRLLGLPATWREGQDSIGKGGAGRLPIEKRVRYVLFVNRSLEGWQAAHDTCPRPFTMLPMVGVRARHFVIDDRVLHGVLTDLGMTKLTQRQFEADSLPHWQKFIQYSQLQNSGWEFARRVETDGVSISVHFVRSQAVTEPVELPFIGRKLTATSDYDPTTHIAVGVDPGVTQAIKAGHAQRHQVTGQVLRQWEWELSKGQLKHDSGLTKAKQNTARWSAAIQPQLLQLAAATPAGTSLGGLHAHVLALKATWDALWEEYLKPRWRRQRLALHHAQERVIEAFCKKVVNGMKWVSRHYYHQERGVAVFLGAGNFCQGGWKAGAVRAGFRKVVEQPSRPSADPRPDRLVIVDEFRTSRVSSSVHARQPCELHLPPNQPRPADWVPPEGQVNPRLAPPPPPPAQAQPLPAAPGPAPPPQAPPGGRWLDRDTNGCLNLQRIGESRQRPIELCIWDDLEALPPIGKEYQQGYKLKPAEMSAMMNIRSSRPVTQATPSRPARSALGRRCTARAASEDVPVTEAAPIASTSSPAEAPARSVAAPFSLLNATNEAINGRAAMLGFVAAVGAELASHQGIVSQVAGRYDNAELVEKALRGSDLGFFAIVSLVTMGTLAPRLLENEAVDARSFGPFTPGLEKTLGRAAMMGFAGASGSGQQDQGQGQAVKVVIAERRQVIRLALHHAQERVIEAFCKKVVNGMKWVSRHYYHQERGVAVFLGAGNFSQGGWKAGAVRAGFRKVVEQPSRPSADPRPDQLVIVDEFRTSRVSSSVHARQPCELHLPPNQPRPADWVPPAGQVNPRLVRPAWSLRHAKYVRGLSWCHQVPPNPPPAQPPPPAPHGPAPPPQAPPGGRWLDRDTNGCLNLQRIGESRQRPIELCIWDDLEALPPIGKEYQQRYKLVNDRLPKGRQWLHRAAEYRRGIDGRARNNA